MIRANALALPGIAHGFFTRGGGVSGGVYASLNCGFGSGDDRAAVSANRDRAMARLGLAPGALRTVYQVHGHTVATADAAPWPAEPPKADAMVADRPGTALGILTADCAPVLLADTTAGVIGAAHAGWRGALDGVVEATVAAMRARGATPARLVAAVGPCIGEASYEVGPEMQASFIAKDPVNAVYFRPGRGDRLQFDLTGFVAAVLARAGVGTIEVVGHDTCAEAERFFSFRRATHRGERDYGRQLSAIALVE